MPQDYEREVEKDENTLKEDIALRIVEATNSSKGLYGSLSSPRRNTKVQLEEFLEDFWSLYDATIDQVDEEVIKKQKDIDEESTEEGEEPPLTIEELQSFFMNPYLIAKEEKNGELQAVTDKSGNPVPDPAGSAQRAISIYREYKKWLRKSGILDLASYSPKGRKFDASEDE